ncbi:hypothetical protein P692DRAFT_20372580 [Suillus brevipes Sb2]|nr:hypothetical protein P692DRAFT_20372580 [Suillus brevipes Sb2]
MPLIHLTICEDSANPASRFHPDLTSSSRGVIFHSGVGMVCLRCSLFEACRCHQPT